MDDALQTKKNRMLSTGLQRRNAFSNKTENIGQAECFGKKERERNSIMTCKMVMCINQRMTFIRFFEIAQNPSQIRRLF